MARNVKLKFLNSAKYAPREKLDPLRFYSWPIVGRMYRRRVELCLTACNGGHRILEVGFGSGITFLNLGDMYSEIYGIDLTSRIDAVKSSFANERLSLNLINGNVLHMPYDESFFDTVLLISILEHLRPEQLQPAFREINRVLKPGGQVVFGVPVERASMRLMFRFLGYNIREHHFSTDQEVVAAAQVCFGEGTVSVMNSVVGEIYVVGAFEKRK